LSSGSKKYSNHPKLAKELLENPEAMRDHASRKANDINFKVRYSKLVETALKTIKRKTRRDKKPSSGANHVLLAHARARARARDWGKKAEQAPCNGISHSLYHDSGHV
jgi:predicted hydrolase (HD superfamily)